MKKYKTLILLVLALVLLASDAHARLDTFSLGWWTVDGGGGTSASGSYTLSGTVGQPDPGVLAGGDYALIGGFWPGRLSSSLSYSIYLPLVMGK